jgi:rhamnose utilization protein RhaD (predicted bifunctional aldolase and dehydrogenase)
MDACVRGGAYDDALDLHAFVSRLALLHPDLALARALQRQADASRGAMAAALLARLDEAVERHGTLAQRLERDYAALRFDMRRERYRLSPATVARTAHTARTARTARVARVAKVARQAKSSLSAYEIPATSTNALRNRLRDRHEFRRAIVLREVLGPPLGLR